MGWFPPARYIGIPTTMNIFKKSTVPLCYALKRPILMLAANLFFDRGAGFARTDPCWQFAVPFKATYFW